MNKDKSRIKDQGKICICMQRKKDKLEWAELNQAETVRLQVHAKLRFQV